MKPSLRSKHGLRMMTQLAIHYGQGLTQIKTIAEGSGICDNYIKRLVFSLKAGGIIRSKQWPAGGYFLSRPPSEINLSRIVSTLEGPGKPTGCVKHKKFSKGCCRCVMAKVWGKMEKNAWDLLESTTLQDLIDMEK